jgi:DNA polymerase-3 subunit alpha
MSVPEFVHLHVHTDFSSLDGACRIEDLAVQAKEWGMPAVACTDHGNMSAAIEFYEAMSKHGIKPIIGCEFYVAPSSRKTRDSNERHNQGFHLVLLAQDFDGYQSLCRLNTSAWLEGHYYKPRVDKEILAQNTKGVLALSACVGGEIPARILEDNDAGAVKALQEYLDIFGRENFFLEVQDHGMEKQRKANRRLLELADDFGLPVVATNDAHYLRREHAAAHDVLLCIGTQAAVSDTDRMRYPGQEFYFKSAEEMASLFSERPDALQNTLAVAERCNLALKVGKDMENHYPVFAVPSEMTRKQYLRQICLDAIPSLYGFNPDTPRNDADREVLDRLDTELGIIDKTGFVSYFLIVWDFIHFARETGIPVGPGRGSGAGSIVAYLTRITDIDPLRYGLLFERFLNPDRVSPPDFDIDLCERRRQEVIAYVRNKYGDDSVAQIGTFGTLKAKAVIKDVARTLQAPFNEVNKLTKFIPNGPKVKLESAIKESKELQAMADKEAWVRDVLKHAMVLEGLNRNMSIHAAGVIIGDQPITNLVPLATGSGDEVITQYSAGPCENLGLLKMDFLGLRTLTIIQDTVDLIRGNRNVEVDTDNLPLDDQKTYELLNRGDTISVFQLESPGMRDLCRRFGVNRLEDIIALIALYRPGPMQFLDEFIQRKTGQQSIDYDLDSLKPILEETYGIMLYQEQVMQVVQKAAGFSLGQADILRRAMGKKKVDVMEKQFGAFVEGCGKNGIPEGKAKSIWDKIAKFAGYGFNKSHSAAYGMLSYRTAYLKANFPIEFMAANLTSEIGNAEKLRGVLRECGEMGITVSPPDVNSSGLTFSVEGDRIMFGLGAIKGVGSAAAQQIIDARKEHGKFQDLLDFCEATDAKVNRRIMENLCRSGAFDRFGLKRSQVFSMIDSALARAQDSLSDRAAGQASLFDMMSGEDADVVKLTVPDIDEWDDRELLGYEKELLGFYVTGHPLTEHLDILKNFQFITPGELLQAEPDRLTRIGGIITGIDMKRSKKDNRPWSILEVEGLDGTATCLVFADVYEKFSDLVVPEKAVFLEGKTSRREEETTSLMVSKIIPLEDAPELLTSELHVHVYEASTNRKHLEELRRIYANHPGTVPVVLCAVCASGEMAFVKVPELTVANTDSLRHQVRQLLGEECLVQKADREIQYDRGNGRRPPAGVASGVGSPLP